MGNIENDFLDAYIQEKENEDWEYFEHQFQTSVKNKIIENNNTINNNLKLNVMIKSKVEKIVEIKPWTGTNGTVHYHSLVMDNGDKINIGKKKELAIGEELCYEILETGQQEYNKAKAVNPEFQQGNNGGGKNDDYIKGIEVGHAINNAVNLTCAGVELDTVAHIGCKTAEEKIYETAKVIMMISERLKSEK